MHVVLGAIHSKIDSGLKKPIRVRPEVCRFVVVGDDADPDSPPMSIQDGGSQSVVCDREDADIDGLLCLSQQSPNALRAISLRTEPRLGNLTPFYQPSRPTAENAKRIQYLFDNDIHDLPNSLRPSCHRDKQHAYISMYGRMHWDKPAQTLTSGFGSMGQGRFVHPTRPRLITPHEAARLQGFPDFFDFTVVDSVTALREMIANAVPPPLTLAFVAEFIRQKLV